MERNNWNDNDSECFRIYLSNAAEEDSYEGRRDAQGRELTVSTAGAFRIRLEKQLDLHRFLQFKGVGAQLAVLYFQIDNRPLTFTNQNYINVFYKIEEDAGKQNLYLNARSLRTDNRVPHRLNMPQITLTSERHLITFLNKLITQAFFWVQIIRTMEVVCDQPLFKRSVKHSSESTDYRKWDPSFNDLLQRYLDIAIYTRRMQISCIDNLEGFPKDGLPENRVDDPYLGPVLTLSKENRLLNDFQSVLLLKRERGRASRSHIKFVNLEKANGINLNRTTRVKTETAEDGGDVVKSENDIRLDALRNAFMRCYRSMLQMTGAESRVKQQPSTLTQKSIRLLKETRSIFVWLISLSETTRLALKSLYAMQQDVANSRLPTAPLLLKAEDSRLLFQFSKATNNFPTADDNLETSFSVAFDTTLSRILGSKTQSGQTKLTVGPVKRNSHNLLRDVDSTQQLTHQINFQDQRLFGCICPTPKALYLWR
jgi:hypothetical protein